MQEHDVVVIGGGISGLSLAVGCARRLRQVLVLEAAPQAGGCLRTHRSSDGFWLELGAHTCYNSYTRLLELIEATCGLDALLPRRRVPFRMLWDDRVVSLFSRLSWPELLIRLPRLLWLHKQGATVRQYYSKLVGPGNYQRFLGAFLSAVPSQCADDLPAEMLFKKRPRRKQVERSFTARGGLQTIAEALAAHPGVAVRTGCEVTSITRARHGFTITTASDGPVTTRRLALATPPPVASSLLAEAAPRLAALLATVKVVQVHSTAVVLPAEALDLAPVAGIVPLDDCFFSVVSRDTVPDDRFRGFCFHFKPEVSEDEQRERICQVLKIRPSSILETAHNQVVLPSPALGHATLVAELVAELEGSSIALTGNYFGGLAIEDCVSRSTQESRRLCS